MATKQEIESRAEGLIEHEILLCQSSLVDELLKREVFSYEDIQNLTPDPSEWTAEEMVEWLKDRGIPHDQREDYDAESDEAWLEHLREAVTENAEMEEIFEWWAVSKWLAEKLIAIGEPVLDNDYGLWWGRACTGQQIKMDGTMQKIAERILDR